MISKILLSHFRNFDEKVIELSPNLTTIVGPNAIGKTNILEALHLLSTGKSFKASKDEEMINYLEDIGRVKGRLLDIGFDEGEVHTDLEVLLTRGLVLRGEVTEKTPKKRLLVDGTPKRRMDFLGRFPTVLFRPQDLDIVMLSPSIRRNFLDTLLSQVDREYVRSLSSYEKGLRRRNKVLQLIREGLANRSMLFFWDNLLIKNGEYITDKRSEFLQFVNDNPEIGDRTYDAVYDKSVISEARLAQYAREEVAAGTTLVGPHRDDMTIQMKTAKRMVDVSKYASRGEARLAVLWLKLAELSFIEKKIGIAPTLLLDDIFSELDEVHREHVHKIMSEQQTIMTTADTHYLSDLSFGLTINLAELNINA
ncbi:DNA replication and repair protein RecF [Candidatus Woesebacteria bacterium]|jgi:DNA replication and repair protein RecF|nr:DNA replication and repair protein RecF [Candidatus Woesebacteria bacterium]